MHMQQVLTETIINEERTRSVNKGCYCFLGVQEINLNCLRNSHSSGMPKFMLIFTNSSNVMGSNISKI
jgi:hypothetical protein